MLKKTSPTTGIRFWVERADAIRMPETYDADNYFNSYELGTNSFRGFTANGCHSNSEHGPNCTQAIDGTAVWDVAATDPSSSYHEDVLYGQLNGTPTSNSAKCGQWLDSTIVKMARFMDSVMEKTPHPALMAIAALPVHITRR